MYAAADSRAEAERAIRTTLGAYVDAHPDIRPTSAVRVAKVLAGVARSKVQIVGIGATIGGLLWAILRVVLRPFIDESRLESWKRKAPEAERFMRESMFKGDMADRDNVRKLAEQAFNIATNNANSIHALTTEVTELPAPQSLR